MILVYKWSKYLNLLFGNCTLSIQGWGIIQHRSKSEVIFVGRKYVFICTTVINIVEYIPSPHLGRVVSQGERTNDHLSLSIHGFRTKCLRFIFHVPSIQHAYTHNVPFPPLHCCTRGRIRVRVLLCINPSPCIQRIRRGCELPSAVL